MPVLEVHPARVPLRGEATLPGDKSLSHRAALFAALAAGESRVANFLDAGVTRPLLQALTALGVAWRLEGTTLVVRGQGLRGWRPPQAPLDCGHSATTMRLLAGALAAAGVPAVLDGSEGLRRRPMRRVTEPLRWMGVPITDTDGHAPLHLAARPLGQPLRPLVYDLPVASAQVKTALLLAALAAQGTTRLREPGPSRDHTERLLAVMGAPIRQPAPRTVALDGPLTRPLRPLRLTLPGDISSAAFLIAAALLVPGSEVHLRGVLLNPTRTGFLDAVRAMGADLTVVPRGEVGGEPVGDLTVRHTPALRGIRVAGDLVVRMIDEFPAFAVVAAAAQGVTEVAEAEELRHKESDRIAALVAQLRCLGIPAEERPGGFVIPGGRGWAGGQVHAQGDHRLAMALAVAGLAARGPVRVEGAEMVYQSFPTFVETLQRLGAPLTWA